MIKITSLLCLFLLFSISSYSQLPCATPSPTPEQYLNTKNVISKLAVQKNAGTTCIPIRAHIIRQSNGTGGVTLEALNEGIAELNEYYLPAGIEFYLCGETPDYLDSDTYYDFYPSEENAMANAAIEVNNALNLYFVNTINYPTPTDTFFVSGYAYYPSNSIISTRIVMDLTYANFTNTMVHEMGHWFSLYHTFETSQGAENVARPPSPNANCENNGDLICDTHADPGFTGSADTWDWASCSYIGNATDANGELYTPDIDNVMSYYPNQCQNPYVLTPEQHTRIAQGLITRQGHSAYSMDYPASDVNNPSDLTVTSVNGAMELNWIDNSNNEMGFLIERSTISAIAGFEPYSHFGTAPNITTFTDNSDFSPSTTYWYRVKASNDNCNHYSNVASITTGLIYCDANASCDEYISNVTLGEINNNSACGASGYSNYSNISTTLTINQSYPFSVDNGNAYNGDQCGIWIDWNQDGDFVDANETIVVGGGPILFNGNITPPVGANIGETTMRVRITFTGALTPCGNLQFGETEDYTINVVGGGNPGTIQFSDLPEGVYEGGTHFFFVTREGGSDGAASVTVTSQNGTATAGSDFDFVNVQLDWADGEDGIRTVFVPIAEDVLAEGIEDFSLNLSNVVNATLGAPIAGNINIQDFTELSIKVILEGPYDENTGLMSDILRPDFIPTSQPFTELGFSPIWPGGFESVFSSVLDVTGNNAIVDWIYVEIHSNIDPFETVITKSALLQRDGDIVDTDGVSPLKFEMLSDYIVVVRHRNHFGVRSLNSFQGTLPATIDFTNPATPVYGFNAMKNIGDTMVLISGNANGDSQINPIDKNTYWRLQNAQPFDYINSTADFNMDGAVNPVDKNIYWRVNNSKTEQIE